MMDPETLGQLVDEHAAGLVLYARQWTATPEDVVQDAFLKLVIQKKSPHNPVSWLYRVVRNQAISVLRSEQRRRKHETRAAERAPSWFQPKEGLALDAASATRALRSLQEREREVITLHLWGGLTFAEIADVTETPTSTVHRWYLAGLANMRERLNEPCPSPVRKI